MAFFVHDFGVTHEMIPRLENRRLKTRDDEEGQENRKDKGDEGEENMETENE